MTCISCGAAVPVTQKFCGECGSLVRTTPERPDDPLRAELGAALGATYELGRLLGRGGMGAVYLARERALDRMVAVKVLPPEIAGSEEGRERFRREARTAARLTHQNIVPLYTFGETAALVFYVMGYVRGESLADRLKARGSIPPDDARRILADLASALEYAHAQGVVHRDIKPDNILLDEDSGRPMLADFGIAKASASGATLTIEGAILGTPHYMSPEQASGDRTIDGRSDLYALGVLGHAMLSGKPPFDGANPSAIIAQHLTREPPPIAAAGVPDDLTIVIRRCLEKEPAQRWQRASELQAALSMDGAEIEMSVELEVAKSGGLVFIGMTMAIAFGAYYFYLFPPINDIRNAYSIPFWKILLLLGLVPLGGIPTLHRTAVKAGLARDAAWRLVFHLPDWMTQFSPWPRAWRRKGDVWDGLPRMIKIARSLMTGAFLTLFLGVPAFTLYRRSDRWDPEPQWIASERRYDRVMWSPVKDFLLRLMVPATTGAAFFGSVLLAVALGNRRGLSRENSAKLISTQTRGSSFWKKPEIAALLAPGHAPQGLSPREPRESIDYQHAIRDLAARLPSSQQMLGAEAVTTARHVVEAIGTIDMQIRSLERDADSTELARLEARLADAAESSGQDAPAMHALLTSQRDLLRRMQARLDEARTRRARWLQSLRTLWLQMADLRAAAARDELPTAELTGRVRSLCDEVQRQVEAGSEVDALIAARGPTA